MGKVVCEICGGANFIKQDGMFVCQGCGIKYTVEEVKKLMTAECVPATSGGIDKTNEELEKWYVLARRAKDENNAEDAKKYYAMVLVEEPNSWEAIFYSAFYGALQTTNGAISYNANKFESSVKSTLKCIRENVPQDKQCEVVELISSEIIRFTKTLFDFSKNWYDSRLKIISPMLLVSFMSARGQAKEAEDELFATVLDIISISYSYGQWLIDMFSTEGDFAKVNAILSWKNAKTIYVTLVEMFGKHTRAWSTHKATIQAVIQTIDKEIDKYSAPTVSTTQGQTFIEKSPEEKVKQEKVSLKSVQEEDRQEMRERTERVLRENEEAIRLKEQRDLDIKFSHWRGF